MLCSISTQQLGSHYLSKIILNSPIFFKSECTLHFKCTLFVKNIIEINFKWTIFVKISLKSVRNRQFQSHQITAKRCVLESLLLTSSTFEIRDRTTTINLSSLWSSQTVGLKGRSTAISPFLFLFYCGS